VELPDAWTTREAVMIRYPADERPAESAGEILVPQTAVAPDGDVDALERAIALCCIAGVLQLPPGGVLLLPESLQPGAVRRGRLVSWEITKDSS
jgi:hypothetical protein